MSTGDYELTVYLDDGRTYSYDLPSQEKATEHASAIVSEGYRHTHDGGFEQYGPHRIKKVKVDGKMTVKFPDRVGGT
jgi:hypothetical protein